MIVDAVSSHITCGDGKSHKVGTLQLNNGTHISSLPCSLLPELVPEATPVANRQAPSINLSSSSGAFDGRFIAFFASFETADKTGVYVVDLTKTHADQL